MSDSKNESRTPLQGGGERAASPDALLVGGALDGHPEPLDTIMQRLKCVPRMLASLNSRLGRPFNEHDLADLSQETLIVVWRKLPTFGGKVSLERWVFRICSMCLMNALRKANVRRAVSLGLEESDRPGTADSDPFEYDELHARLAELPEPLAEVLRMKHFDDLTFEEIATAVKSSPNTIKTRYYRARELLLEALSNSKAEAERPGKWKARP